MRAYHEVRLRVLVDQPGTRLQPLPLPVFGLKPVRYHPRRPSFEYCNNTPSLPTPAPSQQLTFLMGTGHVS
jgi:hypothetical protein